MGSTDVYPRAMARIAYRYAAELLLLDGSALTHALMKMTLTALADKGYADCSARLRVLRQLVLYRLYEMDCQDGCDLEVVMQGMTDLAEVCIAEAAQVTHQALARQHGAPQNAKLWIVGMGKLGARELNVSSDIDLIFVYDNDGQTTGEADGLPISHHDFFCAQVKAMQMLLAQVTDDGFVFRVDLALRPYGRDGALACSLASLSQYFQRVGREWERFAWLKSRVLGGEKSHVLQLRGLVRSFVFRRFLDHKVFITLRELHGLIRASAHPTRGARDVKLGRGGIREIEFAAQVMQIVRGGRQPELLARPTLTALKRLNHAGLMDEEVVHTLSEAYVFLRRVEHRIQYLDDMQTHLLPVDEQDLIWLAHSMGFSNVATFEWLLNQHRDAVAAIFEQWVNQRTSAKDTPEKITLEYVKQTAPWTVQYLRRHPDVADELVRPYTFAHTI